jgi:hypothetical protein
MANQKKISALLKFAALCFVALLITTVFAHEGMQHVMGTVKTIGADSITVETKDNKEQVVSVNSQTKFVKAGKPSSLAELKAGDRVVIHAKLADKKLVAAEVSFGAAPSTASTKAAH